MVLVVADVQQLLLAVAQIKLKLNAKQVLAANGQLVKDAVAANGKILAKGGICSTTVDSSTNDG